MVAQIIVLTMPAASHLAIHFRDERRREADPRQAARSTLAAVAAPIVWTAITGAIGYGALVTSDVVPIQQFGAILATCTFARGDPGHADLADRHAPAVSPGSPRPARLALAGGRADEPADPPGLPPSRRDRPGRLRHRLARWPPGLFRLSYETNYINLFRPETRVVQDYHTVESKLGGIGLVELVVPVGRSLSPRDTARPQSAWRIEFGQIRVADPQAIAQVLSLATVLDPDGRLAALAARSAGPPARRQARADRRLAPRASSCAASGTPTPVKPAS